MSSGLLALLDDVAAIAKVAAASLDDAATQATAASTKAAGIVIDDTAVTPRYVVGFAADRELPIIGRIAAGSLKNKLLYLLPGAILLSLFAPWLIIPLLMAGGAYLCFEGYEKVHEWISGDNTAKHHSTDRASAGSSTEAAQSAQVPQDPKALEDQRVSQAIRTDLILSAEIMAIALASVERAPFVTKVIALIGVAVLVTVLVYGLVALIVKADDVGVVMARQKSGLVRAAGRGIVAGMPGLLRVLSTVGTLAMLWVGGGIIIHGLHEFGLSWPEKAIHSVAHALSGPVPVIGGLAEWLIAASLAGACGLAVGWVTERAYHYAKDLLPKSPQLTDF